MADSRLHKLAQRGQSIWIDYLSRDMVHGGELAGMMREDAVTGVTSNPTIFQKAISQGNAFDEQLRQVLAAGETDTTEIFLQLAVQDVRDACDLLRSVCDEGKGADAKIHRYRLTGPGQHIEDWESWLYPVQPPH